MEETLYYTLQVPVNGRHYHWRSDQYVLAWQESAVMSAKWALSHMDAHVRAELA